MSKTKEEFGEEDDHRIILQINRISSSGAEQLLNTKKPFSKHTPSAILLTKSSSKSEDSLDSGVYTRQKSNDSIDSLDSNESGVNGVQRECSAAPCPEILTPTNEAIPPLPIQQYEDYMREVQDIRQSIIVKNQEEGKQTVSRSNSGDDPEDDNEADWFRRAGLSDLVITSSASMMADSQGNPASPNAGGDNFSSMTVLSTLTRPQREAVLRRITSFNRAQKTKRRPKLAITAVFPDVSMDVKPSENGDTPNTPKLKKPDELALKSTSLHHDNSGGRDYTDSRYQRRHSEISSVMHKQDESPSPVSPGNHMKMDYRPKHKKSVQSVVATNPATGVFQLGNSSKGLVTQFYADTNEDPSLLTNTHLSPPKSDTDFISIPTISSISTSLPDLNNSVEGCLDNAETSLKSQISFDLRSKEASVMRQHSIASDRSMKALSDIPITHDDHMSISTNNTARLLLKTEVNFTKTGLTPSVSESAVNVILSSKEEIEQNLTARLSPYVSKPDAAATESSSNVHTTHSTLPESNHLVPELPSFGKFRSSSVRSRRMSSPTPSHPPVPLSPTKLRKTSKRSPLHKLSLSISNLSSFGSTPSRIGSKKVKSLGTSSRKSLRRVRSLKFQKSRSSNLTSSKSLTSSEIPNSYNFAESTSIETLSISPHGNDTASWSGSREELSMHSPLEGNKNQDKSMSYSETAKQESLPNFSLVKDKLGITKISDVSPIDLRKVQTLALIELTALFDMRNIDLKRRKLAKTKPKDSGVLGVPLTTLVEWDRKKTNDPNLCVPLVLRKIISFLETNALKDEGILRKSGSATRTKLLKQAIDSQFGTSNIQDSSSSVASFDWSDAYPNDVAAILKEFLRGLPEPLLTTQYIDAIQSCGLIPDRKQQLQALNLLIILLNEVHRSSLKVLLQFLGKVVAAEAWNKMSLNNVAVIIAPNLFLNKKGSKRESSNTSQDLKHAAGTSNIVRMLIKYQKLLWAIPAFMLIQVRNMNRAEMSSKKHSHTSKEKYKGFFRGRGKEASKKLITRGPLQAFDYETPLGLVRIQAPNMNLTSMAVQMDGQITAGDILARYQRQCGRMRQSSFENLVEEVTNETHALYEVGGNIHERCLDPDANLSAILQVNPDATWFIRARVAD